MATEMAQKRLLRGKASFFSSVLSSEDAPVLPAMRSMIYNDTDGILFDVAEYRNLCTEPLDNIVAGPKDEKNFFEWEALLQGPEGTPFEGGIFPATLVFPKDYPLAPPTMKFDCEMWHPNGTHCFPGYSRCLRSLADILLCC